MLHAVFFQLYSHVHFELSLYSIAQIGCVDDALGFLGLVVQIPL